MEYIDLNLLLYIFFVLNFSCTKNYTVSPSQICFSSFSIRQGTQAAVQLSMGWMTGTGKSRVVRRWWHGCRGDSGEFGLLVDLGQVVSRRPQLNLFVCGVVADGGLQLICCLHTAGKKSAGQTWRPLGSPGSESSLRWRSWRSPEDGAGGGRRGQGALATPSTGADAEASYEDDEGHNEGGSGDVKSPAGHGGSGHGNALSAVQLREVLQVGEIWLMESQFANVFKGLAHQLHFSGRHEREGVPVPLVVDDTVVEPD